MSSWGHRKTEYCANCEATLHHGGNSATSILPTWIGDGQGNKAPTPLSIYEALSVIFEVPAWMTKKDVYKARGSKFRRDQGGGEGGDYFGLCYNCTKMLTVLYDSFQEFTSACRLTSEIGKILRELEKKGERNEEDDSVNIGPVVKVESQEGGGYCDEEDVAGDQHSEVDAGNRMSTSGSPHGSDSSGITPPRKLKTPSTSLHLCRICRKEFLYETTLICHRRIIHQENIAFTPPPLTKTATCGNLTPHTALTKETSTCPICRVVVPRNHIRDHLSTHTRSHLKPWMCLVCGKEFRNQIELHGHAEEHKASIPCQNCGKMFPRLEMLAHIRLCFPTQLCRPSAVLSKTSHSSENRWKCKLCNVKFTRRDWAVSHMAKHMQTKRHSCKICDKRFDRSDLLRLHVKRFHRNNEGPPSVIPPTPVQIEMVDMDDNDDISLPDPDVSEEATQTAINSRGKGESSKSVIQLGKDYRFACKGCHLEFVLCDELEAHLMKTHADRKTFTCSICNRKLQDAFCLSLHLKCHSTTKPYVCYICDHPTQEKFNLFSHLKNKHNLEDSVIVERYPNVFVSRSKHLRRNRRKLDGEKSVKLSSLPKAPSEYACEVCGKVFRGLHAVKKHKKVVHDKVKEYICSYCGKSFARRSYFFTHERLHTSTETPYKCHLCGKGFRLPGNLRGHLRSTIHSSERSHICETCGKTFNRRENLRLHVKCVHMKIPNKKSGNSRGTRRVYGPDLSSSLDSSENLSENLKSEGQHPIPDDPLGSVCVSPVIDHTNVQPQQYASNPTPHSLFSQAEFP